MFAGLEIEHLARCEQQYLEAVVYPAAARRAQQEAELRLLRQSRRVTPSSASRRLGAWLTRRGGRPSAAPASPTVPHA